MTKGNCWWDHKRRVVTQKNMAHESRSDGRDQDLGQESPVIQVFDDLLENKGNRGQWRIECCGLRTIRRQAGKYMFEDRPGVFGRGQQASFANQSAGSS